MEYPDCLTIYRAALSPLVICWTRSCSRVNGLLDVGRIYFHTLLSTITTCVWKQRTMSIGAKTLLRHWDIIPSLVLLVIAGWLVMKYVWVNDFSVSNALISKSALFGIQYALKWHDFSTSTFYFFLDVSLLIAKKIKIINNNTNSTLIINN